MFLWFLLTKICEKMWIRWYNIKMSTPLWYKFYSLLQWFEITKWRKNKVEIGRIVLGSKVLNCLLISSSLKKNWKKFKLEIISTKIIFICKCRIIEVINTQVCPNLTFLINFIISDINMVRVEFGTTCILHHHFEALLTGALVGIVYISSKISFLWRCYTVFSFR